MKMRGHNFVWHRALPPWFATYVTPQNAEQVLVNHIETVAGRYKGRIHSWDVVNEAIQVSDNLPNGMRNSPWQKVLPNYIDIAFRTARRVDPHAILTYNDYGIEAEDAASTAKRSAVLALVRGMQQRGVPIDAVGIQSHIHAGPKYTYGPALQQFMADIQKLGLKMMLTEMDVNDRDLPADIPTRDNAVADALPQLPQDHPRQPRRPRPAHLGHHRPLHLAQPRRRPQGRPARALPPLRRRPQAQTRLLRRTQRPAAGTPPLALLRLILAISELATWFGQIAAPEGPGSRLRFRHSTSNQC